MDRSVLFIDAEVQYLSYFVYLGQVVSGHDSATYARSLGLGGNPIGMFAYYLASPPDLVLAVVPEGQLPTAS